MKDKRYVSKIAVIFVFRVSYFLWYIFWLKVTSFSGNLYITPWRYSLLVQCFLVFSGGLDRNSHPSSLFTRSQGQKYFRVFLKHFTLYYCLISSLSPYLYQRESCLWFASININMNQRVHALWLAFQIVKSQPNDAYTFNFNT